MKDGYYWKLTVRAGDKFDPNQPRVPAGSPRGGQWTTVTARDIVRLQGEVRERFPKPVRDEIEGKIQAWYKENRGRDATGDEVLAYMDAFELSKEAFVKYSEKFGIEDPEKIWKDFDLENKLADKEALRKTHQLLDSATFKWRNEEVVDRIVEGLESYERPYGDRWSDAKNHVEDDYGVTIKVEGTSHLSPEEEHRQYSILANLADKHPAVAHILRENVNNVVFRPIPPGETKMAEWIGRANTGDLVVYDHGPDTIWPGTAVYIHELGHAAEPYVEYYGGNTLEGLGFGEGRFSSTYGQTNSFEDWAEWWLGAFGDYDPALRSWDPDKFNAARSTFEKLGG